MPDRRDRHPAPSQNAGTVGSMDQQRVGQKAFNDLHAIDPEIADLIRGTTDDPFYDDSRLDRFHLRVAALRAIR